MPHSKTWNFPQTEDGCLIIYREVAHIFYCDRGGKNQFCEVFHFDLSIFHCCPAVTGAK